MNIDELDFAGNKVCEWCFLPEGNLAAGDVMLAQKIALETFAGRSRLRDHLMLGDAEKPVLVFRLHVPCHFP